MEKKIGYYVGEDKVIYTLLNRRLEIEKKDDDWFSVMSIRLVVLSDKEKLDFQEQDSNTTKLIHRPHSKYCLWVNRIAYSREAMECLGHFARFMSKISHHEQETDQ